MQCLFCGEIFGTKVLLDLEILDFVGAKHDDVGLKANLNVHSLKVLSLIVPFVKIPSYRQDVQVSRTRFS